MKMNKSGFMAYITSSLVFAFIILIIFLIIGGTGGFKALAGVGKILAKIPAYVYVGIGFLYLLNEMRGK